MKGAIINKFNVEHTSFKIFYISSSFFLSQVTYQYDFAERNRKPIVLRKTELNGFDESKFIIEETFYPSDDLMFVIPLFIIRRIDMKGPKPCLIDGYGGFGVVNQPRVNPLRAYFLTEFDGIVAFPLVRGEGARIDLGWHDLGRNLNKKKSFDDFKAAARHLVKKGYTEHSKIAITGISHGGLLVAASMNQAPELFRAAIPKVGVYDMLRFHHFGVGHAFIGEFGDPRNKTEFDNLHAYSPLHNIPKPNRTKNRYPATLILAANCDDQVPVWHSLKFAAELQHKLKDNKFPLLLRVYKGAGHDFAKTISQRIEVNTDELTFLHKMLNVETESA